MKLSKFFNKISLILQALWSAVLYLLIEAICSHSFMEAWTYMTGKPLYLLIIRRLSLRLCCLFISSEREFSGEFCWQLMAVSGNRKRCSSSEPCHTVYRPGCKEPDRWPQHCKEIPDTYPDDDRCGTSWHCSSDPSDHSDKIAEIQRQTEIQGEYSAGSCWNPCFWRNHTACSGKKSTFQLFWKHCHCL